MKSDWSVVYHSGRPSEGEGPFSRYVQKWLTHTPEQINRLRAFAQGTTLVPDLESGKIIIEYDVSQPSVRWLKDALPCSHHLSIAVISRALNDGPKLLRPTSKDCEALEQVELSLDVGEYTQPFPTCVVEFPPDYSTNRLIPSLQFGGVLAPRFAVICQENGTLSIVLSSDHPEPTISGTFETDSLSRGPVEALVGKTKSGPPIRAALNYLMLATGRVRAVGPTSPRQAEALRGRLKLAKKRRRAAKIEELRERLRLLPTVYALSQEIRLFDREPAPSEPNPEADGAAKRPHWRKGHWRHVAVGAGRVGRELRFIRPVLVNGHLLPE